MEEFTVSSQTITPSAAVVRLAGDMDLNAFDLVEDEFSRLLESGVKGVALDLGGLGSLSSSAIGAIIDLNRLLAEREGKLVLAGARPDTAGLLEMLGLGEAFAFADNVEAARKTISAIK